MVNCKVVDKGKSAQRLMVLASQGENQEIKLLTANLTENLTTKKLDLGPFAEMTITYK
jgi:hypothetical protein